MKRRLIILFIAILVFAIPAIADNQETLGQRLQTLRYTLQRDYHQMAETKEDLLKNYEDQHQEMVDIMKHCNELSLRLYSQKQEYTLDLCFALEKVKSEYEDFNKNRMPYERIVSGLDIEIERYNHLIESLHNIDLTLPILDENDDRSRDTCIFFANELLKLYTESRDIVVADSIHYNETYNMLQYSYEYARDYYKVLQRRIFIEGQTPWNVILANWGDYWAQVVKDIKEKYTLFFIIDEGVNVYDVYWEPSVLLLFITILLFTLLLSWIVVSLLALPMFRFIKPLKKVAKERKRQIILLVSIILCVLFDSTVFESSETVEKAITLFNTFMWLLAAIVAALLIRLEPKQLRNSIKLYLPTIFMAIAVIGCRVIFAPNTLMNFIFPPVLIVFSIWQFLSCLRHGKTAENSDRFMGWTSLAVTVIALLVSIAGYIFAALMILIWWYFQLAAIHTMTTIWFLTTLYKEKRMIRRIGEYRSRITFVSGDDKEALMFGATWFYDLVKEVVLPAIVLMSIPFCIRLALNVFDFDDIYQNLYKNPFYQFVDTNGVVTFRISLYAIILLIGLVFVFRYINKALHVVWQQARYNVFMRKNNRTSIRKNEINLSLGNSLISVMVWVVYSIIVIVMLKIPTGSLGLVLGGFSAGIGLALKDIINNFIYSIQLMSGRLTVGDWIECDGVRGVVTKISYQSTQVETINATTVSFLNADLFAKSFTNLTKSNSYEFLKIPVGVAYGSDVQRVREILEEAMQVMRTKDPYGREVVDPKHGIYVVVGELGDNAVEIWVKQYVLAAERIEYIDRAKEVIYNALNANGIEIPYPHTDVRIINEVKENNL